MIMNDISFHSIYFQVDSFFSNNQMILNRHTPDEQIRHA